MARDTREAIVHVNGRGELVAALEPGVPAAIAAAADEPWREALSARVAVGAYRIERTVLPAATVGDVERWLMGVPDGDSGALVDALRDDVMAIVELQAALTGAVRFLVRIFTGTPSRRCGFHVDTVAPRAPAVGLLRVYGGRGTEYVEPDNVTSVRDFYRALSANERAARVNQEGLREDDAAWFLRDPGDVRVAPAGSLVAFKHLDVRRHWPAHPADAAWIHRSPMEGQARLVVNVTAREPGAR